MTSCGMPLSGEEVISSRIWPALVKRSFASCFPPAQDMVPSPKITAININFFMVTASMAVRLRFAALASEALCFSQGHDPADQVR